MYRDNDIGKLNSPDPEEQNELQSRKSNSKIYFFIIAIVALLATNVYFYIKFKSSGEKLYTVTIQKQDLQREIDRIEAVLDNLVELKSNDPDPLLEDTETKARMMIHDLRDRLENNMLTDEDMSMARSAVLRLKEDVSDLRSKLVELKAKHDRLRQENERLANKVVQADQKRSSLTEENTTLKDKGVTASALKVSNIQVNGVSISKKGEVDTETRAKRVDRLQILFSIVDNDLAPKGNKEVFVRVIDPSGNLLGDANNIFYVHGEKLQYTFKDAIDFTNKGEEYQFLWELGKFRKGAYTVLLYTDNAIMGRASVVLK